MTQLSAKVRHPPSSMERSAAGERPRAPGMILTTRVGLRFPPGLTFEQWAEAGPRLSGFIDSFAWCLGDWLIYGQDRYRSRYAEALEKVALDYQTLRNYAWVARKFPISRRRSGLSFQHHAEVASLPPAEQDRWLDQAEQQGWSRNQLRRRIGELRKADGAAHDKVLTLPRLRVEGEQLARWQRAASRMNTDLADWIVESLDRAAAEAA